MTGSLQLEHLLSPIPVESFLRDTWQNEPLVVTGGDRKRYAALLALDDIDQIIAFSRPKFADQGAFQSPGSSRATYVRGSLDPPTHAFAENPGIAEIRQVFDDGKSIVIMALQHRWEAVAALCRGLEAIFRCPVHANMYLTPAGSQGFAAHFDTHEVFILQLEGSKRWRLYGAAEELPLVSENVGIPKRPLGPSQEVCLEAGDFLYIPRGYVHEAFTTDSLSLHLTVGINVYRWADLLRHAVVAASRRDVRFRKALPGGALPGDKLALKAEFKGLLALLADDSTAEQAFDGALRSLGDQFFSQLHMLPAHHFSLPPTLDQIDLDTVLERPAETICRVVEDDMGVAIEFPGNRVGGPHRIASALQFVASNSRFAVRSLPDELNADARIVLMRRLVREGLLTIVLPAHDEAQGKGAVHESHAATDWGALETEREMQREMQRVGAD